MTTITDGDIVRRIISFQLICHPLPWEVEEDWTFEVKAKDGTVIVKTPTRSEADRVIEIAVKGMLPKGPLGYAMLAKLKVYAGGEHPHAAQQPQELKI